MSDRLEILSDVMLSLKVEQGASMRNINALLGNSSSEINLIDKVKIELGVLSSIHAKMQECESFMLQIAQSNLKIKDNSEGTEPLKEK